MCFWVEDGFEVLPFACITEQLSSFESAIMYITRTGSRANLQLVRAASASLVLGH